MGSNPELELGTKGLKKRGHCRVEMAVYWVEVGEGKKVKSELESTEGGG